MRAKITPSWGWANKRLQGIFSNVETVLQVGASHGHWNGGHCQVLQRGHLLDCNEVHQSTVPVGSAFQSRVELCWNADYVF